jgi:hypothetical protein
VAGDFGRQQRPDSAGSSAYNWAFPPRAAARADHAFVAQEAHERHRFVWVGVDGEEWPCDALEKAHVADLQTSGWCTESLQLHR